MVVECFEAIRGNCRSAEVFLFAPEGLYADDPPVLNCRALALSGRSDMKSWAKVISAFVSSSLGFNGPTPARRARPTLRTHADDIRPLCGALQRAEAIRYLGLQRVDGFSSILDMIGGPALAWAIRSKNVRAGHKKRKEAFLAGKGADPDSVPIGPHLSFQRNAVVFGLIFAAIGFFIGTLA